jgi:hypothetical protein
MNTIIKRKPVSRVRLKPRAEAKTLLRKSFIGV